mgnify:FL=1
MEWISFLPSVTTTLLAILAFLSRNLILTRLTKSVQHEYDGKLEALKAELKRHEGELLALRSGALDALAERRKQADMRRIEAIETLWQNILRLQKGEWVVGMAEYLDISALAARAKVDPTVGPKLREMTAQFNMNTLEEIGYPAVRPFVPESLWMTYSHYHALVAAGVAMIRAASIGMDFGKVLKEKRSLRLEVEKHLSSGSADITDLESKSSTELMGLLQEMFIAEARELLWATNDDERSLREAARLIKSARDLNALAHREEALARSGFAEFVLRQ